MDPKLEIAAEKIISLFPGLERELKAAIQECLDKNPAALVVLGGYVKNIFMKAMNDYEVALHLATPRTAGQA